MQARDFHENTHDGIRMLVIIAGAVTLAVTMTLAISPPAESASLSPGTGGNCSEIGSESGQPSSGDTQRADRDNAETQEHATASLNENVMPGFSDVLDAELGLWWLDNEPERVYPKQLYPYGPYK